MEYIDFWVSNNRVRPPFSELESIKEIGVPTKVRGIRRSVGLVKYYRDMWHKRTHTLRILSLNGLT